MCIYDILAISHGIWVLSENDQVIKIFALHKVVKLCRTILLVQKEGLSEQHTVDGDHRNMLPRSNCDVIRAFTD